MTTKKKTQPKKRKPKPRPEPRLADIFPPTGKLVMLSEMSELLGVSVQTAWSYIHSERLKFPAPEDTLGAGAVWSRKKVEAWKDRTLPLPVGRPPTRKRPKA